MTLDRVRTALASLPLLLLLLLPGRAARAQYFEVVPTVGYGDELRSFALSHRDPNFVVVGTSNGKIHRSVDGGKTWQEIVVTPYRSLFFGRERHADPRLEYALGLPGKSPHLQRWLRTKGLHTSGINLQQLLVLKGDKMTGINWIEVDWHNENRLFIGTTDGLYRSDDKGRTFVRIWQGLAGTSERVINTVVTDPGDPRTVLVGTARGLFHSRDRGITFRREMNFYVRDSYIRALFYDTQFKGLVHMAMAGAAMASPDHGKHWITTHWDLWSPRSDVQWISLGPGNLRAIGTRDGVFASWQGGEMGTWKRRGYRFVTRIVSRIVIMQEPNVWYATTDTAVWRSDDYGNNWVKVMQLGGHEYPMWLQAFDGDPEQLWFMSNRRLYRLAHRKIDRRPAKHATRSPARMRRLLDVPDLHTFWRRVMRHKHLYWEDMQDYRDRAPWSNLLPDLSVGLFWSDWREPRTLKAFPYQLLDFRAFFAPRRRALNFEVFAFWDFSGLVFDRRELPHFGRIDRNLRWLRQDLSERVRRMYTEYRTIARSLVSGRASDPLTREFERIRLQEIGAFFDLISDGFWTRATGGVL